MHVQELTSPDLRVLILPPRCHTSLSGSELELAISSFVICVAICHGTLEGLWVVIWTEEPGDRTVRLAFIWLQNSLAKHPLGRA